MSSSSRNPQFSGQSAVKDTVANIHICPFCKRQVRQDVEDYISQLDKFLNLNPAILNSHIEYYYSQVLGCDIIKRQHYRFFGHLQCCLGYF